MNKIFDINRIYFKVKELIYYINLENLNEKCLKIVLFEDLFCIFI